MSPKKNPKFDLERKRFLFFQTGLLVVGASVLAAFSWESPEYRNQKNKFVKEKIITEYVVDETRKIEKELQIQPKIKTNEEKHEQQIDVNSNPNELSQTTKKTSETNPNVGVVNPFKSGNIIVINPKVELPDIDLDEIVIPDIEASFPGGYGKMVKFIQSEINYPEIIRQAGIQGKVYVQFVVEKDGSISAIEVKRGVDKELDREAKRIIRQMPKWIPGETKGLKVRTHVMLPINFVLE